MRVYYITIFATMITSLLAGIKTQSDAKKLENKTYNTIFVLATGLILTFVASFRWNVGTDYNQYAINYTRYIQDTWVSYSLVKEPGIRMIAKLSSVIYNDYVTMFLIASVITIGLSIKTISKHSNTFSFSVLLYIFIGSWHGSFNGVRQYLACAIIFAGHRYIIEKRPVKYMAIVLIASLFHISALAMIGLYFIPKKRLEFKKVIIIILVSFVIIYSYDVFLDIIGLIKDKDFGESAYALRKVNNLRVFIAFAPLLVYYGVTSKASLSTKESFYINILIINAALTLATSNSAYLSRFNIYTNMYSVLGIPALINVENKYIRFNFRYIIIILYALFWYVEVSNSSSLANFQWIFNRY